MSPFPDCELHHVEQRTPEWRDLRRGRLTASDMGPWLQKDDSTSRKAREGHLCRLVAEIAGCWSAPDFQNAAMQRGVELEAQALEAFQGYTRMPVRPIGFASSVHGRFGCSPDGLIDDDGAGLEMKVPVPATHITYRRAGVLPSEYLWQVHGSMAVTGATSWWFWSWNPGLAPLLVRVERDEFTDRLRDSLVEFSAQLEDAIRDEVAAQESFAGKEVAK